MFPLNFSLEKRCKKSQIISRCQSISIPTFIISRRVLNTMSIMMKYSNGVDTTIRHTLYLKLFRSFGMYLSSGRAPIVKSMHDFWRKKVVLR